MDDQRGTSTDDKLDVRDKLDLGSARWRRAEPEGEHVPDAIEIAFVPHADGVTYVVMRQPSRPESPVLTFTPSEWNAFVAGARDGEFDIPVT